MPPEARKLHCWLPCHRVSTQPRPLVVVTREEMMTPPAGLASFRASGDSAGDTGALMAAGVMITAPLVLGFVAAQRHLLRGLRMVAAK